MKIHEIVFRGSVELMPKRGAPLHVNRGDALSVMITPHIKNQVEYADLILENGYEIKDVAYGLFQFAPLGELLPLDAFKG